MVIWSNLQLMFLLTDQYKEQPREQQLMKQRTATISVPQTLTITVVKYCIVGLKCMVMCAKQLKNSVNTCSCLIRLQYHSCIEFIV